MSVRSPPYARNRDDAIRGILTDAPDGPAKGRLSPLFTWRSCVASADGPKDAALSVVRDGEESETTVKGTTQRHVALTLSLHMSERGDSCYPGVARLVAESGLSTRAVQRALLALRAGGWIRVAPQGSPVGTNLYTATVPASFAPDLEGGVPGTGGAYPVPAGGVPGTPEVVIEDGNVSPSERLSDAKKHGAVADAWRANSPPLIAHRAEYFETAESKTAIRKALKVYDVEAVAEAFRLYATVLAGARYRWEYRWTLRDFLARGLDRFVPEAEPLKNFAYRDDERKPTAADVPDLDAFGPPK